MLGKGRPVAVLPEAVEKQTSYAQETGVQHEEAAQEKVEAAGGDPEEELSEELAHEESEAFIHAVAFGSLEAQHVKYSDYDPFTDNAFVLDLDELSDRFSYPYKGKKISDYGYRGRSYHTGVDIKAVPNDTIRSAFDGVVRLSRNYSGYGNIVVIRHSNGVETVYSHNSKNLVTPSQYVQSGTPVALAGRTGRATTEHLHFEVRVQGQHFNPNLLLDTENHCLRQGKVYIYKKNNRVLAANKPESEWNVRDNPEKNLASAALSVSSAAGSKASEPVYYRVKKGDTLSAIAKRNGTSVAAICNMNNISPNKLLQINQQLKVR